MFECIWKQEVNLVCCSYLPCILRWSPALSLTEPAAKFGWPVRPGELPVPASPAHWLRACIPPHLPFMWVLGCWIQGPRLVQQACYPTASHPSSPGLGFEFKWACMSLSTPGSRQPPWNITGYLNGHAQDFISPLPPWLSSKYTRHVLGEAQSTCSEWEVELMTRPRWFLLYG